LQNTSSRDLGKTSPEIRAALVCGTYQIFYLDRVPDRAAVNESVEYVRKKGQANAVSFVNGILRQIARRAEYFAKPDKEKETAAYLALQFSHPRWIVDRWIANFKAARTEAMLVANNQPPPYTVRVNALKTEPESTHLLQQRLLKEERTHSERRPLRSALRLKEAPNLEPESLFSQGLYAIQDEASQLIGYIVDPQPNTTLLDACSGPGGKLTHLAELCPTASFISVEVDAEQLAKAKDNFQRLQSPAKIEWVHGAFQDFKPSEKLDKILLDAPCSGLGVLRRHPEGKWQKQQELITRMAAQQRQLLLHAISLVKPGGDVIYSVCSYEPEETLDHLDWLRGDLSNKVELVSPVSRLPDYYKKYVTRENALIIYSGNQDQMDGFGCFVIKLKQ
jgi:16S rRNA (cytosine967-C5)-methyltransferase